jgi:D-alanyl-D-alanine carboxypeptidase
MFGFLFCIDKERFMRKKGTQGLLVAALALLIAAVLFIVSSRTESTGTATTKASRWTATTSISAPSSGAAPATNGTTENTSASTARTTEITTAPTEQATTAAAKNQYAYAAAYPNVTPAIAANAAPGNYLLCVSRAYSLPAGYSSNVKTAACAPGSSIRLESTAAAQYRKMYDAALQDGATLTPYSGYRSTSRQKTNFDNKISYYVGRGYSRTQAINLAAQRILPPGCSEHEAGLAMDIVCAAEWFKDRKEYRWLLEHGWEYGFILRYPADKTELTKIDYEPWHWRYVGIAAAQEIMARKLCLEEYLGMA